MCVSPSYRATINNRQHIQVKSLAKLSLKKDTFLQFLLKCLLSVKLKVWKAKVFQIAYVGELSSK